MKTPCRFPQVMWCGLAGATLLLASCAPAAAPAPPAPVPQAPAPAVARAPTPAPSPTPAGPKRGGILKIGTTANPASFDVQQENTINVSMLLTPVYNTLVQYDAATGSKMVGGLAESWQVSENGNVITFKMRAGVRAHDGTPFGAEDVVFNLQRNLKPPKGILSNMGWALGPVKSIQKVGEDSVRVAFEYPYAPFLSVVAHEYLPLFPRHIVVEKGDTKTMAVGTGPFKFKAYTPSATFELVRNADYWEKGLPYLDGVTFYILPDRATYVAALRTGQIQRTGRIFGALTALEVETVKKGAQGTAFVVSPALIAPWLQFNARPGSVFSDARARQAVSMAIDRQAAVQVLAEGQGHIGGVFSTYKEWGLSEQERLQLPGFRQPKDQDIAEAKKLLVEADFPTTREITILSRRSERNAATFLTGQLQSLGLTAKVDIAEDALFWPRAREGRFDLLFIAGAGQLPDPQWMVRYFTPGFPLDYSGLKDEALVKLAGQQVREQDSSRRRAMIQEIESHLLAKSVHSMPLVWPFTYIAVAQEVKAWVPGLNDYIGNRLETVWLAQ